MEAAQQTGTLAGVKALVLLDMLDDWHLRVFGEVILDALPQIEQRLSELG